MSQQVVPPIAIVLGAWWAIHCARAAIRELRTGVAFGRHNAFRREAQPVGFWLSIVFSLVAASLGAAIAVWGCAILIHGGNPIAGR